MSRTAHEQQHFAGFVRVHRPVLQHLAGRLCRHGQAESEDLVQETLERALQNFDRLSQASESEQKAWLCTTFTNLFLDRCRRQRREVLGLPGLRVVQEQDLSSGTALHERWRCISENDLHVAMDHLKPKLRKAYELHASGMRYREIAQQLGAPIGTVGSWISEAREELRQFLTRRDGEQP